MTDNQTATGVDLESVAEATAALNELAGAAERVHEVLRALGGSVSLDQAGPPAILTFAGATYEAQYMVGSSTPVAYYYKRPAEGQPFGEVSPELQPAAIAWLRRFSAELQEALDRPQSETR